MRFEHIQGFFKKVDFFKFKLVAWKLKVFSTLISEIGISVSLKYGLVDTTIKENEKMCLVFICICVAGHMIYCIYPLSTW